MTVTVTSAETSYTGDDGTTAFPTVFVFGTSADIEVIERVIATGVETTKTLTTHYTVSGGGGAGAVPATGTVTAVSPPASTVTWTIRRVVAESQASSLPAAGAFPSATVEEMVDRTVMMVQQATAKLTRVLTFPRADSSSLDSTIPSSVDRASKFLAFDSDGNPIAAAGTTGDSTSPVSAFMDTVLDDTTAAAARTTLGAQETLALPSQAEAEAGTATTARSWSALRVAQAIAALGSAGLPRAYIAGLTLSNNGTDADHDINIAAGSCRNAANTADITLGAFVKQIDATWSAGSAAGGLASSLTAPAANTWYHVFAIIVGGTADAGFDTSITGANLIADHTATSVRRIGSVLTNGTANIIAFLQVGDDVYWDVHPSDVDGGSAATTGTDVVLSVPIGLRVTAKFNANAGGAAASIAFYPKGLTGATPGLGAAPPIGQAGIPGQAGGGSHDAVECITDTAATVKAFSSASIADMNISTVGWADTRGRNA